MHADTVNCFKSSLNKFWSNQDLIYHFRAQICGTESRSEVITKLYNISVLDYHNLYFGSGDRGNSMRL